MAITERTAAPAPENAPGRASRGTPWRGRIVWFVGLWAAGVAVVAGVAWLIRLAMGA